MLSEQVRTMIVEAIETKKNNLTKNSAVKDIICLIDRDIGISAEEETHCTLYDTSNGTIIEQIKFVLESGIDELTVSLHLDDKDKVKDLDCYFN
jgi:hypothetical protein